MIEHRRSPRKTDYLPVDVHVVSQQDGHNLAGPFSGRIIDISDHGACLLMSQIIRNGYHLFYSTQENEAALFQLDINTLDEDAVFSLQATPVWMTIFNQQEIRAFKIGVNFTGSPDEQQMQELQKIIRENQEQRAHWWKKHYKPQ